MPNQCPMMRASRTIRTLVLGSFLALLLGTTACVGPLPAPRVDEPEAPAPDLAETVAALVAAHNRVRAEHRRAPLTVSAPLEAAARRHALDMARRRRMSHRGGDGSSPFRRMAAEGYAFRHAGENVAAGYESVDAVMKGWMWSPGHRRNILGQYTEIGAACASDTNGAIYWCVTFGTPLNPE